MDLFRQKRRYQQDLKMSKQEIRDEFKEMEGNPLMKQRIRRLRRDMARRRMMHEVPTATAVIVNPTHYAVALKYDMDSPGAPMVVAKGKNYLALRIRQKAIDHQVPLIENPPLAQALYKSVDVGQEIPAAFLPRRGRGSGLHFQADEWQADCMSIAPCRQFDDKEPYELWHRARADRACTGARGSSAGRCSRTGRNWACRSPFWAS